MSLSLQEWDLIPIQGGHEIRDFDCGDGEVNKYLRRYAIPNHSNCYSRTFVIAPDAVRVVAFVTLLFGAIQGAVDAKSPTTARREIDAAPAVIPVLEIAHIGVDKKVQRQGVGEWLLAQCIYKAVKASEFGGLLALMARLPTIDLHAFFARAGFEESDELSLVYLLSISLAKRQFQRLLGRPILTTEQATYQRRTELLYVLERLLYRMRMHYRQGDLPQVRELLDQVLDARARLFDLADAEGRFVPPDVPSEGRRRVKDLPVRTHNGAAHRVSVELARVVHAWVGHGITDDELNQLKELYLSPEERVRLVLHCEEHAGRVADFTRSNGDRSGMIWPVRNNPPWWSRCVESIDQDDV